MSNRQARRSTDAGSRPWCGKGFFSQSTLSTGSLMVSVHPLRAIVCINIGAPVKSPKRWQPYHCSDTWKYCTHWQEWVALIFLLLCLTQVRQPKFPARDKEVLCSPIPRGGLSAILSILSYHFGTRGMQTVRSTSQTTVRVNPTQNHSPFSHSCWPSPQWTQRLQPFHLWDPTWPGCFKDDTNSRSVNWWHEPRWWFSRFRTQIPKLQSRSTNTAPCTQHKRIVIST